MAPSGMENPTLHIRPGSHSVITVTNNTSGGMDPMELYPSNCGDHFMNTASVNIHYHGTNTSLACGQDIRRPSLQEIREEFSPKRKEPKATHRDQPSSGGTATASSRTSERTAVRHSIAGSLLTLRSRLEGILYQDHDEVGPRASFLIG
jgi:hypothetical protein